MIFDFIDMTANPYIFLMTNCLTVLIGEMVDPHARMTVFAAFPKAAINNG